MAYKDKLRSSKGAKENTLDKAGKQLEKNSNDKDAGIKKKGNRVVKTKGKMTLDKAGGEIGNFGNVIGNGFFPSIANKARAFFEGGCTRNESVSYTHLTLPTTPYV